MYYRDQVGPQQISQYRGINGISLDPGFSDGSGLERVGQDRFYPYTFQEIVDDSLVPAGLQHRLGGTINVAEESLEGGYVVLQGCPTQSATSLILEHYT